MRFSELLDHRAILILDGAMGSELQRLGVDISLPLWSAYSLLHAPHIVRNIHFSYLHAGADILTTNTFRTNFRTLQRASCDHRWEEMNLRAVQLAMEARERYIPARPVLIAGGLAPVEDCYRPDLVPSDSQLIDEHSRQAEFLAMSGVDMLLIETMMSIREAVAAANASAKTGKEFLVSFVCTEDAMLLSGESLIDAAQHVVSIGASAVLVNCVSALHIRAVHAILQSAIDQPTGAYPNIGTPQPGEHTTLDTQVDVVAFYDHVIDCVADGARIVGGCCGTTPEHIESLVRTLSPETLLTQRNDIDEWKNRKRDRRSKPPLEELE